MVTTTEKNPKVGTLTWLQCQLPKSDWEALNKRRVALGARWADILVPAAKEYILKLEAKPTDARAEAAPSTTMEKQAEKKASPSKTPKAKKQGGK